MFSFTFSNCECMDTYCWTEKVCKNRIKNNKCRYESLQIEILATVVENVGKKLISSISQQ